MGRPWYDVAFICLNGHVITDSLKSFPEKYAKFCTKCGEKTTSKCESCNADIRGYYNTPGVIAIYTPELPLFCWNCGEPYPWTSRKIDALNRLVEQLKRLDEREKEELRKSIDELVRESSTWRQAAHGLKRLAKKISDEEWKPIRDILVEIISTAIKSELGLS